MDSITVKNFRCFREEQTARMAPLTLLVGENSTGKTSFLALLRALWDVAFREVVPDFRETPYDLGSFGDIVHRRGSDERHDADCFEAGFEYRKPVIDEEGAHFHQVFFRAIFKERWGVPFPVVRSISGNNAWVRTHIMEDGGHAVKFGTAEKEWERTLAPDFPFTRDDEIAGLRDAIYLSTFTFQDGSPVRDESVNMDELRPIVKLLPGDQRYPYAGAPVRSYPKRTYDPIRPSRDPEGEYIPAYLANMSRRNSEEWTILKSNLEKFGKQSGLFDEIKVNSFGDTAGSPFQLHIGKLGKKSVGSTRNLIDVGYGVSQVLPLITELFNPEPSPLFLLQQPEVHLHPSAQAALGTLFCSTADPTQQLVVETHSDYIIDRVLMDVRDETTNLKAEDVSILYFEQNDLDVTIHSLQLDDRATILDPPDTYRQFFMAELRRSVGL